MSQKKNIPYYIFAMVTLLTVAFVVIYGQRDFTIPEFSLPPSGRSPDNQVPCLFEAQVNQRHLRMGVVLAVENRDQREDLLQKLPLIRHDLLLSADRPEFVQYLEIRDFEAIRNHIFRIVNRHTQEPVDHLFFESWFFDY